MDQENQPTPTVNMENSDTICTTPASARPVTPSVFDNLAGEEDEQRYDLSFMSSPGSQRCPTFKDYSEKIRALQQDNFQLRLRIYLTESKNGVKYSKSELADFYEQLKPMFENAGSRNGTQLLRIQGSSSSSSVAADRSGSQQEVDRVQREKSELEDKVRVYEESLAEKDSTISRLNGQVEELSQKIEEITSQLNSTMKKLAEKASAEDAERMAYFAFEQNEEVELINAEWQAKLKEKSNEVIILEAELEQANRKLETSDKKVGVLKSDIKSYESKLYEMSEALKELGRKCARTERQNEKLFKKLTEKVTSGFENLSSNNNDQNGNAEKFSSIRHLVGMLQGRMKELTHFVETLLRLESKKVITLTGLTNGNRENLQLAVEHCRTLSKNLDELFEKESHHFVGSSHFRDRDHKHSIGSRDRHRHHSSTSEPYQMFSPAESFGRKNSETQCTILDSTLAQSLEAANVYITRLKQDISTLERMNTQLGEEKTQLNSQVKSLESSVQIFKMVNHDDKTSHQIAENNKIKEENRKLLKRLTVTEDALRNLHGQHADLVGELKTLKSGYEKQLSQTSVESVRPSDSTSPDLGIDSGHDGAANSDDSATTNYKEENRVLRTTNRELALKLKQTRQALDITLEKLNTTAKEKEQVEKAICRQLHKTHTILRQAKKSVEKFTNSQCQENIKPPSP